MPVYDFSGGLGLLGQGIDSLGQSLQNSYKQQSARDLATALANGDFSGAMNAAARSGDANTVLKLRELQQKAAQDAQVGALVPAILKSWGSGGDTATPAAVPTPGAPQTSVTPVTDGSGGTSGGAVGVTPAATPAATQPGAYDTEALIRQKAIARGINPDTAVAVARSEGLVNSVGDRETSFGPFQLHYGGIGTGTLAQKGLGDEFTRQTGLDARDPSTTPQQIDFALDYAKQHGWGSWYGWKGDKFAGIGGRAPGAAPPPLPAVAAPLPPIGTTPTTTVSDANAPTKIAEEPFTKVAPVPAVPAALPPDPNLVNNVPLPPVRPAGLGQVPPAPPVAGPNIPSLYNAPPLGLGPTLVPGTPQAALTNFIGSHIGLDAAQRVLGADPSTPMLRLVGPGSIPHDDMGKTAGQFVAEAAQAMRRQGFTPGPGGAGGGSMTPVIAPPGTTPRAPGNLTPVVPPPAPPPGPVQGPQRQLLPPDVGFDETVPPRPAPPELPPQPGFDTTRPTLPPTYGGGATPGVGGVNAGTTPMVAGGATPSGPRSLIVPVPAPATLQGSLTARSAGSPVTPQEIAARDYGTGFQSEGARQAVLDAQAAAQGRPPAPPPADATAAAAPPQPTPPELQSPESALLNAARRAGGRPVLADDYTTTEPPTAAPPPVAVAPPVAPPAAAPPAAVPAALPPPPAPAAEPAISVPGYTGKFTRAQAAAASDSDENTPGTDDWDAAAKAQGLGGPPAGGAPRPPAVAPPPAAAVPGPSQAPPAPIAAKVAPTPAAVAGGDPAVTTAAQASPAIAQSLARTRPGSDQRMLLLGLLARAAAGSSNPEGNLKLVETLASIEKAHQQQFEQTKRPLSDAELAGVGIRRQPGMGYFADAFGNISTVQGAKPPSQPMTPSEAARLPDPGVNGVWMKDADGNPTLLKGGEVQGKILSPDEAKGLPEAPGRVWFQKPGQKPEPLDPPQEEKSFHEPTDAERKAFPGVAYVGNTGQPHYPPAAVEKSPQQLYDARLPVAQKLGLQPGTPEFNAYMAEGKIPSVQLTLGQLKLADESNRSLAAIDENLFTVQNAIEQAKAGKMNFGLAGRAQQALSGVPGFGTEAAANTAALDADIQNTILGNLRTIFGGQVRVSEMNRAMSLKPSTAQSQAEFLAKAQDYVTHLKNLKAQEEARNAAISDGSYFVRGRGAGSPLAPGAPVPVPPGTQRGEQPAPAAAPVKIPAGMTPEQVKRTYRSGTQIILPDNTIGTVP